MSLPGSCTSCEAVNKADDRFCGGCGVALGAVARPAPPVLPSVIPSVPKKAPPPAPPKQRTLAIETLSDVVLSEQPIG